MVKLTGVLDSAEVDHVKADDTMSRGDNVEERGGCSSSPFSRLSQNRVVEMAIDCTELVVDDRQSWETSECVNGLAEGL